MQRIGPAAQALEQFARGRVQCIGAHITMSSGGVVGPGIDQGHTQALGRQLQRQRAPDDAGATYANIERSCHEWHCRSGLQIPLALRPNAGTTSVMVRKEQSLSAAPDPKPAKRAPLLQCMPPRTAGAHSLPKRHLQVRTSQNEGLSHEMRHRRPAQCR